MRRSNSLFSLPSFILRWSRTTSIRMGTKIASATNGFNRIAQTNGGMNGSLP